MGDAQSGSANHTTKPSRTVNKPSVKTSLEEHQQWSHVRHIRTDSPLPPRKTPSVHTVESKRQNPTDDSREVAQQRYKNHTRRNLIRPIPIAQLQDRSGPHARFSESEEGSHGVEPRPVCDGGVTA